VVKKLQGGQCGEALDSEKKAAVDENKLLQEGDHCLVRHGDSSKILSKEHQEATKAEN
jgi:hypothetical protein